MSHVLTIRGTFRIAVDFGDAPVPPEAVDQALRAIERAAEAESLFCGPLGTFGVIDEIELDDDDHHVDSLGDQDQSIESTAAAEAAHLRAGLTALRDGNVFGYESAEEMATAILDGSWS